MDALVAVFLFIAGMLLGTRLLAALYGPIDLWYRIRTAWPVALLRIAGWGGATAAVLLLLGAGWRPVFLAGMGAHALVHVGTWLLVVHSFPRRLRPTRVVE